MGESSGFAGRIIPKISVTQLGATLALWSGVPHAGLASIFPDLANFPIYDLNFFND